MGYFSTRGLRGDLFEELINKTNTAYMDDGLAIIQKLPTAIKPVELDQGRGVITLAYFDEQSTVDYMGHVQGIPVCFDAKETAKKSLPISNIHAHQIDFMEKFRNTGGISYMLVSFTEFEKVFLLDFETLFRFWNDALAGGRKSIPVDAFNADYEVRRKERYLVHYLEALERYIQDTETDD